MKLLLDDSEQYECGQYECGQRASDLRLDRALVGAEEFLDAQMLLDSLKEQLDLPALFVQCSDSQWRRDGIISQKDQRFPGLWILETYTPRMLGIVLRRINVIQADHDAFGGDSKERSGLARRVQPYKEILVTVELASAANKYVGAIGPVPRIVRVGQHRTIYHITQTHRLTFVDIGAPRNFDIAQTFALGQLCKHHDPKLFGIRRATRASFAAIPNHNAREARPRNKLHDQSKRRLAYIHGSPFRVSTSESYT